MITYHWDTFAKHRRGQHACVTQSQQAADAVMLWRASQPHHLPSLNISKSPSIVGQLEQALHCLVWLHDVLASAMLWCSACTICVLHRYAFSVDMGHSPAIVGNWTSLGAVA